MDSSGATFSPYPSRIQTLVVDGRAVGTHSLNHGRVYSAWISVEELPPFALGVRGRADETLFGPRQPTKNPAVDGLVVAQSPAAGLPAALLPASLTVSAFTALEDTRLLVLCSGGQLQIDVLAPEERHLHQAIDLAKLLVRRVRAVAGVRRTWSPAVENQEIPEEEVDAELVALLIDRLEALSAWVTGDAERQRNEVVVRCQLEAVGAPLEGQVAVRWMNPDLTALRMRAQLQLPGEQGPRVELTPEESGPLAWLRALGELKLDDRLVDDTWRIRGDAQARPRLLSLVEPLGRMASYRPRLDLFADRLVVSLEADHAVGPLMTAFTESLRLWRAAALSAVAG